MTAVPKQKYTIEEYLDLLHESEERLEYFNGEIVSMAGGKISHNRVARNIARTLGNLLEDGHCEAFDGQMPVKTVTAPPFRFPDASAVCGKVLFENVRGHDVLTNPILIVEVLSRSTKGYDRDAKFLAYQAIESFREYLLVAQESPHVIQYVRQPDAKWLRADIIGLESEVRLESVGVSLPLSDIYRMVEFPPSEVVSMVGRIAEPED